MCKHARRYAVPSLRRGGRSRHGRCGPSGNGRAGREAARRCRAGRWTEGSGCIAGAPCRETTSRVVFTRPNGHGRQRRELGKRSPARPTDGGWGLGRDRVLPMRRPPWPGSANDPHDHLWRTCRALRCRENPCVATDPQLRHGMAWAKTDSSSATCRQHELNWRR